MGEQRSGVRASSAASSLAEHARSAARVRAELEAPLSGHIGVPSAKAIDQALGLRTVADLLGYYPRRYLHRGELTDFTSLAVGENVTVLAAVETISARRLPDRDGRGGASRDDGRKKKRERHIIEAVLTDGRRRLSLTWFNQRWLVKSLPAGTEGLFSGTVSEFQGRRQLTHPQYIPLTKVEDVDATVNRPIVVYPTTKDLANKTLVSAVATILGTLGELPDPVPEAVRARHGLMGLRAALQGIHLPADDHEWRAAQRRLRWDEAFVLQVVLAQRRVRALGLPATPRLPVKSGLADRFEERLPFTLTAGQTAVGEVIATDLAQPHPMQRLLHGEVGSGKTVVALRAMLTVVDNGGQAALLAPTEVLAQQHHRSIGALLGPLAEAGMLGGAEVATRVTLLTGSQPAAARRRALLDAASGDAGIVVGTHALLQENVDFCDLGLVVVDEQHRFGVEQRDLLRAKGAKPPHLLVMTATPIPRTVAMTVFGDLETSTLVEVPAGRPGVETHVVPAGERPDYLDRTWQRVREEVAAGHQAFVVCPRIGEAEGAEDDSGSSAPELTSDDEGGAPSVRLPLAVLDIAQSLAAGELEGLRVEVLHGRLVAETKDDTMRRFAAGDIDVLVATTVIEVGVDVPNATTMVIMDADRFGVSALHQLRGRVGRGSAPGLCLLVTEVAADSPGGRRVAAVANTTDGFELSRLDLQQRREGDVLGASQSGRRSSLRLLQVIRDEDVIVAARAEAVHIVEEDPELASHPALGAAVAAVVDAERADFLERA